MLLKLDERSEKFNDTAGFIAKLLLKGGVAILPTSTIYGISCVYNNKKALKKVYTIKQRPNSMPFIILLPAISDIGLFAEEINESAQALIKKYWTGPGRSPLTLVFKKNNQLPDHIAEGSDTIALRLDPLPSLVKILSSCGPVISTSATISGQKDISPQTINDIPEKIKKEVDAIVYSCRKLPGVASTIVDVSRAQPAIIREGSINFDEIRNFLRSQIKEQEKYAG